MAHLLSRVETRSEPHWRAATRAGLIGGTVFLVLELPLSALLLGTGPWELARFVAAIVLGRDFLPPPATADLAVLAVALLVHFGLARIYGLLFAFLLFRLDTIAAVAGGAVLGLLVYWVNLHGFTVLFPWFTLARNGVNLFAHLVFGMSVAWSYKALAQRAIERSRSTAPGA